MSCTNAEFEKLKDKLRSYGDLPPKGEESKASQEKSQATKQAAIKAAAIDEAVKKAVARANTNPAVAGALKPKAQPMPKALTPFEQTIADTKAKYAAEQSAKLAKTRTPVRPVERTETLDLTARGKKLLTF